MSHALFPDVLARQCVCEYSLQKQHSPLCPVGKEHGIAYLSNPSHLGIRTPIASIIAYLARSLSQSLHAMATYVSKWSNHAG